MRKDAILTALVMYVVVTFAGNALHDHSGCQHGECHHGECHHGECHHAKCHHAKCHHGGGAHHHGDSDVDEDEDADEHTKVASNVPGDHNRSGEKATGRTSSAMGSGGDCSTCLVCRYQSQGQLAVAVAEECGLRSTLDDLFFSRFIEPKLDAPLAFHPRGPPMTAVQFSARLERI